MIFGMATALLAISACTNSIVPLTGRKVTTFGVSAAELEQQAAIGYSQLLSDPKTKVVANNSANTQMVKRVGNKIAAAVTDYMNANGYGEQIKNYKWEFNLIRGLGIK